MKRLHADVVVPVYRDVALTNACIDSVLRFSGSALARLIIIDDASPDVGMRAMLSKYRRDDGRVVVLTHGENRGFVSSANQGLAVAENDAVVLNADAEVTRGWLEGLLRVLETDDRIAAVSPLSNNAAWCSVPTFNAPNAVEAVRGIRIDLSGLPAFTPMPTCVGFCMLMRRSVLREIGLFDPKYGRGYNEENDWCQRARALGYRVGRANRVLVFHHGQVSFGGERDRLDEYNARRLLARYPHYLADCRAFVSTEAATEAARYVARILERK